MTFARILSLPVLIGRSCIAGDALRRCVFSRAKFFALITFPFRQTNALTIFIRVARGG